MITSSRTLRARPAAVAGLTLVAALALPGGTRVQDAAELAHVGGVLASL